VLVEVILTAKIEAGAIESINFVRGLMENLTAERQFFGDLSLEQPPHKPVILVAVGIVLIDPIAAASISRPVAEILLDPNGKEHTDMPCTETAALIARR